MTPTDAPPTILVIDDDVTMTLLFSKLLGSTGKVVTTNSGEEGLALARQIIPDLILLDVQMPGWDGFDVINELKLDPLVRHVPIIFITAEVLPFIGHELHPDLIELAITKLSTHIAHHLWTAAQEAAPSSG